MPLLESHGNPEFTREIKFTVNLPHALVPKAKPKPQPKPKTTTTTTVTKITTVKGTTKTVTKK
jgi:hypothetical protein